jgi:DNA-binding transcriptional MerR regulator
MPLASVASTQPWCSADTGDLLCRGNPDYLKRNGNTLDLEHTLTCNFLRVVTKQMLMKIGGLARRSGLSAHTIRCYERIGLLPYADRDRSRQRDYDASILTWIEFLGRLKTTGMPIQDMLRYTALRERGAGTEAERRVLLEQHLERVRARVAEVLLYPTGGISASRASAAWTDARAPIRCW